MEPHMGMDVIGTRPSGEAGRYFRNNVWWWGPLWSYCNDVAPSICGACDGRFNDGDGLPEARALALADMIEVELESGRCAAYAEAFEHERAAAPTGTCTWCNGSGVRSDHTGINLGMVDQVLEPEDAERLGRERGWCNGCSGQGHIASVRSWYWFDVENVRSFVQFLRACGGFRIW